MIRYDEQEGYCRMLGHHLTFSYCRTLSEGRPCHKILDCWFEKFDVQTFIETHYSSEEIEAMLTPPQPKILSLLELIEKAKNV